METVRKMITEPRGSTADVVMARLDELDTDPAEKLGQHFLINDEIISAMAARVIPGATIIEIGAGLGQVTEALAQAAEPGRVVAIEIDSRFAPVLESVAAQHHNVSVVIGDALHIDYNHYFPSKKKSQRAEAEEVQIVASLPFHISEPFMSLITHFPLASVVLVVGDKLAAEIQAREKNSYFGRLSLLAEAFFEVIKLRDIPKSDFYPVPRTDASLIELTPLESSEVSGSRRRYILRKLFLTERKSPLVKNVLKETLIVWERVRHSANLSKEGTNRRDRRNVRANLRQLTNPRGGEAISSAEDGRRRPVALTQNEARSLIVQMGLPEPLLSKPFSQLNNQELVLLSKALGDK